MRSLRAAIAVQRKIVDAGAAIDDDWQRLGWECVDEALDALIVQLPAASAVTTSRTRS